MDLTTVEAAAAQIWRTLLDASVYPEGITDLESDISARTDRNGDGLVCLKTQGRTDLNPNSH